LNVYLEPLLIAASHCGFLISAHQQNTLLALEDGWPVAAYIRDGQGTAFVLQKRMSGLRSNRSLPRPRYFCQNRKAQNSLVIM